ncbi:hypothetical protein [Rodentibacter abscessus]
MNKMVAEGGQSTGIIAAVAQKAIFYSNVGRARLAITHQTWL